MTAHAFRRLGLPVQQGDFRPVRPSVRPYLLCRRDVAENIALCTLNLQHLCQTQMGHIPGKKKKKFSLNAGLLVLN